MRTLWIIDAGYASSIQKNIGNDIDFLLMKNWLNKLCGEENEIIESYYMTSVHKNIDDKLESFLSWMGQAEPYGPKIIVKKYSLKGMDCRCEKCGNSFKRSVQKGVDVGIATLMLKLIDNYDRLILFGGDGDFKDAISYIKDKNKEFWLIGLNKTMACDIQSYANKVVWIEEGNYCEFVKKHQKNDDKQEKEQKITKPRIRKTSQKSIENNTAQEKEEYSTVERKTSTRAPVNRQNYRQKNTRTSTTKEYEPSQKNGRYKTSSHPKQNNNSRYSNRTPNSSQPNCFESSLGVNALVNKNSRSSSNNKYGTQEYRSTSKTGYNKSPNYRTRSNNNSGQPDNASGLGNARTRSYSRPAKGNNNF